VCADLVLQLNDVGFCCHRGARAISFQFTNDLLGRSTDDNGGEKSEVLNLNRLPLEHIIESVGCCFFYLANVVGCEHKTNHTDGYR